MKVIEQTLLSRGVSDPNVDELRRSCREFAYNTLLPFLGVYEDAYPDDKRVRNTFDAVDLWLSGKITEHWLMKTCSICTHAANDAVVDVGGRLERTTAGYVAFGAQFFGDTHYWQTVMWAVYSAKELLIAKATTGG